MLISEAIYTYCITNNIGYYRKRGMVANALQELNSCATADEIFLKTSSHGRKVSVAGVYTTLNWLIERGFVEKRERFEGKTLYAIMEVS